MFSANIQSDFKFSMGFVSAVSQFRPRKNVILSGLRTYIQPVPLRLANHTCEMPKGYMMITDAGVRGYSRNEKKSAFANAKVKSYGSTFVQLLRI